MSDRLVDLETEAAYLGSVLNIGGSELERYPVQPDDMAGGAHMAILGAMHSLHARSEEITPMGVRIELQRHGRMSSVGDDLLMTLGSTLGDTASASRRCRELAAARRLRAAAVASVGLVESGRMAEAREVMQAAAMAPTGLDGNRSMSMREAMTAAVEAWKAIADGTASAGIKLRLGDVVDSALTGMPGDTIVVAARTGVGKSSLVDRALLLLAQGGVKCSKVSVEDGAEDYASKALSQLSGVNTSVFWGGDPRPSERDWAGVYRAAGEHCDLPCRFTQIESCALDGVLSQMAIDARAHGCRVIVVDYLQAIAGPSMGSTRESINATLGALIATARTLGVVLILVSQLKRPETGNPFREPTELDLKESGSIEERAQGLVLLWRTSDDATSTKFGVVLGKVAKVKRGPSGQRFAVRRAAGGMLVDVDYKEAVDGDSF